MTVVDVDDLLGDDRAFVEVGGAGARFSEAIISRMDCWRCGAAFTALATSGSSSLSVRPGGEASVLVGPATGST
ncbi:hypothetical protein OG542_35525 [Streptomyces violaceus]|uniref:hypothetical protein n=1 Tax=Streptomyces violaceus TaxID=1936 RepID=UPI002E1E1A56